MRKKTQTFLVKQIDAIEAALDDGWELQLDSPVRLVKDKGRGWKLIICMDGSGMIRLKNNESIIACPPCTINDSLRKIEEFWQINIGDD